MSDFNPAYSYHPSTYAQNDFNDDNNAFGSHYQIGDEQSYDRFFQSTGVAESSESATPDQRQRAMDFAGSLGFSEDNPLGQREFQTMSNLVNGKAHLNTLEETGEIGPRAQHAQAEEHIQAFHGCQGHGRSGDQQESNNSSSTNTSVPRADSEETPSQESETETSNQSVTSSSTSSSVTTGSNGELKLGNTSIHLTGGTNAQGALVEESFKSMYENDPAFKEVIDSKSGSGITVNFQEFTDNTAGMATVGGSDMTMDIGFLDSGSDPAYVAEVIAHEVGHLSGLDHGSTLDSFAKTAGQSVA